MVRYLNQFFSGIGGEEKADVGLQVQDGPVGPGIGLQQALGDRGRVVATIICGDNYFSGHATRALAAVQECVKGITLM